MSGDERKALILDVARDLFGRHGYYGTTTDQIANAAGISQPYVIRIFRSKEQMFIQVLRDVMNTLMNSWRDVLQDQKHRGADHKERERAIGENFVSLAATRGLHTMLLQGFVSGAETGIGSEARAAFLEIYRFLRDEAELPGDRVHDFLASGMLFSVMLAIGMPALYGQDEDANALLEAAFGEKCQQVVELALADN
jgi:AcrR family transcriptional regulator